MKLFYTFVVTIFLATTALPAQVQYASLQGDDAISQVKVYPNPSTSGNFTAEFFIGQYQGTVTLKVYNLVGREVFRQELNSYDGNFKSKISLGNLTKGVYMLEINKGDKRITRRLSYV